MFLPPALPGTMGIKLSLRTWVQKMTCLSKLSFEGWCSSIQAPACNQMGHKSLGAVNDSCDGTWPHHSTHRRQGSACTWWWPALSPSSHDGHWLLLGQFGHRDTGASRHSARLYRNYRKPCSVSSSYVFFQAPSPRRTGTAKRLKICTRADTTNFQPKPFHHSRCHSRCITCQKTKTLVKYYILKY